jgi:hypothetical protein
MDQNKKWLGATHVWITRVAPFLLPAVLFQSGIFALVSPLPLFILSLKKKPWLSLIALTVNIALVLAAGFHSKTIGVVVFWFAVGIFFPYLIRKSGKIQLSFVLCLVYMLSMLLIGLYSLSHQVQMGIIEYVKSELSSLMDHLIALPDSPVKTLVEEQGRDALFKDLMTELPSGIVMALIFGLWINLLFASQLIKGFLSKNFWANYRVPELVIWPTLICAGLFIWSEHALYYIGLNGLKILLVFYGFQGLSVLSYVLNHYKIFGFVRALLFTTAIFLVMPLVLSLGFFDLWFDFRRKLGQT